jgi:hypothetical protein
MLCTSIFQAVLPGCRGHVQRKKSQRRSDEQPGVSNYPYCCRCGCLRCSREAFLARPRSGEAHVSYVKKWTVPCPDAKLLGLIFTFAGRYGEELAKIMKKALWVGQVASLARDIEDSDLLIEDFTLHVSNEFLEENDGDKGEPTSPKTSSDRQDEFRRNLISGVDSSTRKAVLDELLGAWEEPETQSEKDVRILSDGWLAHSKIALNSLFLLA